MAKTKNVIMPSLRKISKQLERRASIPVLPEDVLPQDPNDDEANNNNRDPDGAFTPDLRGVLHTENGLSESVIEEEEDIEDVVDSVAVPPEGVRLVSQHVKMEELMLDIEVVDNANNIDEENEILTNDNIEWLDENYVEDKGYIVEKGLIIDDFTHLVLEHDLYNILSSNIVDRAVQSALLYAHVDCYACEDGTCCGCHENDIVVDTEVCYRAIDDDNETPMQETVTNINGSDSNCHSDVCNARRALNNRVNRYVQHEQDMRIIEGHTYEVDLTGNQAKLAFDSHTNSIVMQPTNDVTTSDDVYETISFKEGEPCKTIVHAKSAAEKVIVHFINHK